MLNAIAAVDKNYGIGYKNELLIHIPNDLKHFKEITLNNIVVMGRKTYESLPNGALPDRLNIVITSKPNHATTDGQAIFMNMDEAERFIRANRYEQDIFIIGGASIYEHFINVCDCVYLTVIDKEFENVDAYFPNIGSSLAYWELVEKGDMQFYNNISYRFCKFERASNNGFDFFK